jgi:hypothetical protein
MPGPHSTSAPFDWMEPRRNPARAAIERARREAMYRSELEERAGLLHRLGNGRDRTRARLLANLAWDFAPGASPLDAAAVDGILDRVFGQGSTVKAGPRGNRGAR